MEMVQSQDQAKSEDTKKLHEQVLTLTYLLHQMSNPQFTTDILLRGWEVFLKPADGGGKILSPVHSWVSTIC